MQPWPHEDASVRHNEQRIRKRWRKSNAGSHEGSPAAHHFADRDRECILPRIQDFVLPEQITYIANHAEDQYLFFDLTFGPLIERLGPLMKTVKAFVALTDRAHMPALNIANLLCYEELIGAEDSALDWPTFAENPAS